MACLLTANFINYIKKVKHYNFSWDNLESKVLYGIEVGVF